MANREVNELMSEIDKLTDEEIKANYTKKVHDHFKKLQLINLESYPYRLKERPTGTFKREDVAKYLEFPENEASQKQLRRISRYLYTVSSQYKLSCDHFASILTLDHYVEPKNVNPKKVNKKIFENQYYNTVNLVEMMNIQHEFAKILQVVYREGAYCGYVHHSNDSFFFQQLDNDYTKITYIEDGLYFISFNLTYFFTYPERLQNFPQEFKDAYDSVKDSIKRRTSTFWYQLESAKTICIKTDESNWYMLPPFVSTFESALNITDFKALDKAEAEIGNYKILFQKIPVDITGDDENKFLITPEFAIQFHDNIQSNLPPQVGLITSPMDVTDISFQRDSVDRNKVNEATMQYWSDAGISQLLFSSNGKTTGASLAKAIQADESKAFVMLYQIERWINKYLDLFSGSKNFRVRILKTTAFNVDEYLKQQKILGDGGIPNKLAINAASGGKASSAYANSFLENEILKLQDNWIPLLSAHTMNGNEGAGAPKSSKPLTESGQAASDNNTNNKNARG